MAKSGLDADRGEANARVFPVAGGASMSPADWVGKAGRDMGDGGGAEPPVERSEALHEIFRLIHKINNHLQVITINAEMMEMMNGGSNRYISKIMDAAILIREQMDDFRDAHGGRRRRLQEAVDRLDLDDFGIG